ncbi:MAG: hypothetical protein DME65_00760 [Verrucomicrobia bacterium]|nr:MAG: hypothetical protein DME65_00760 [Verrucomicrobiota bacterium]
MSHAARAKNRLNGFANRSSRRSALKHGVNQCIIALKQFAGVIGLGVSQNTTDGPGRDPPGVKGRVRWRERIKRPRIRAWLT